MASATVTDILIKFKDQGANTVGAAFRRITKEARGVERTFQRLSDDGVKELRFELERLKSANVNSISSMKAQKNALMALRDMADVTGAEFKQLTADINRMDAALAKSQGKKQGFFSGRAGAMAKTAGAIAGAGIYGGAEGIVGASIGGILGGAPGAITGGVVGAQVGIAREQISGITSYSAALRLQREALNLVIGDTQKFTEAQEFLLNTSESLAIPQDVITRQFTSLTASVTGAGKSVSDAEEVFAAIAAGIRGTGGTLEDMKAAMRATSQVFSKGKVSAEELRQQLGERLPGAFTLFADSMDKTPAELDKALEQGKVTLDDFMKFAKKLTEEYGENAKLLADSPAAAGDRLQTAMSKLKDNLGQILTPIGAGFQDTFTVIVKVIDKAVVGLKNFLKIGEEFEQEKLDILLEKKKDQEQELKKYKKFLEEADTAVKNFREKRDAGLPITNQEYTDAQRGQNALISLPIKIKNINQELKNLDIEIAVIENNIDRMNINLDETADKTKKIQNVSVNAFQAMGQGMRQYAESIKDLNKQIANATVNAFKNMEDALVQFVTTGKLNFSNFAKSVLADLSRMIIRQMMFNALAGFQKFLNPFSSVKGLAEDAGRSVSDMTQIMNGGLETVIGGNKLGNVYDTDGIQKFARGGIVHSPTIFPFKNGIGLMGEAGSEAILPLKRTKQGKLGVESSGGGGNVVNVSVNAGGTSAQGNTMKANQLGKMIGVAIEAELIKQKRPGGILYT